MVTELSDYEKERLANIARNQKVLESLGLVRRDAELHESIRSKEAPKKKRKVDPESAEAVRAAVRRSARLAGAPASSQGLLSPSAGDSSTAGESSSADHSEAQVSESFLAKPSRSPPGGVRLFSSHVGGLRTLERQAGRRHHRGHGVVRAHPYESDDHDRERAREPDQGDRGRAAAAAPQPPAANRFARVLHRRSSARAASTPSQR